MVDQGTELKKQTVMKTEKDALLKRLRNGERVYGTCITATAPLWPAAVSSAGLDFVFLDTEHVPLGRNELAGLCQVYRLIGITPIVRIPSPDPFLACQAIDAGAKGVIAPYLESVEQITELTGALKYRPLKGEFLAGYLSGDKEMAPAVRSFVERYNMGNICIANIESVPALERLDSLLSVKGLDAVFIGPHDLSVSMGLPEEYDHPEFEKAVTTIIRTCRNKGLSVGIHFSLEPQRQVRWIREGANIIVHSVDITLFSQRLRDDITFIKTAAGDAAVAGGEQGPVV